MTVVCVLGSINEETKAAFVAEVERVGRDPVYWVRREACFVVGALAKVVPQEVVASSLVRIDCRLVSAEGGVTDFFSLSLVVAPLV